MFREMRRSKQFMDAVIERNLKSFYMVEIEIEHLTGKEGLELMKQRTNLV